MNDQLTERILEAAFKVHSALGPGLLESSCEKCLLYELHRSGLRAVAQLELPVEYEEVHIDAGYRIDVLVEDQVILELKSVEHILPIHQAQILSYLKLSYKRVGMLLNFNVTYLKEGITRVVNG